MRVNCVGLERADFAQCTVENVEAAYEEGATQQDLYAQQDMAKWALAMVFIAGLTAAITLWALIYTLLDKEFTAVTRLRYSYADEGGTIRDERYDYYIDLMDIKVGERLYLADSDLIDGRRKFFAEWQSGQEPTLFDDTQGDSAPSANHDAPPK